MGFTSLILQLTVGMATMHAISYESIGRREAFCYRDEKTAQYPSYGKRNDACSLCDTALVGGTLTNFKTIGKRIDRLQNWRNEADGR
jgi:hypothetical protein